MLWNVYKCIWTLGQHIEILGKEYTGVSYKDCVIWIQNQDGDLEAEFGYLIFREE